MPETFLSRTYFENDGTIETYAFDWPYLLPVHVLLLTRPGPALPWEVLVQDVDWEFTSPNVISLLGAPLADGTETVVRRQTPNENLLDILTAPSTLSTAELNVISTQLLYLIQEALDSGLSFEGNAIGDTLDELLRAARFTYDISLSGYDQAVVGRRIGPVPIVRDLSLLAGSTGHSGSQFPTPESSYTFQLRDQDDVSFGTVVYAPSGVTVTITNTRNFVAGDSLSMVCSIAGGSEQFNMGATFKMARFPLEA
jgi:Phage T7 tail fibre protein